MKAVSLAILMAVGFASALVTLALLKNQGFVELAAAIYCRVSPGSILPPSAHAPVPH